jgi:predicted flap endonuclease-1-like 5' DNA nuclease
MLQMIEANWLAFIIVLLVGIAVAWWLFRHATTERVPRERRPDALDEGATPASRNQALIDAPPAAGLTPPAGAEGMAGLGEIIAVAAQEEADQQAARKGDADAAADVGRIKGVGPKLVAVLGSLGITSCEQIAGWSEEDIDRIDAQLGPFAGRPRRDNWVEQAKLLTSGDTAAYEARFGKL